MALAIACPKCKARLKLKNESAVGKKLPCPKCKHVFVIQATPAPPQDNDWLNDADLESREQVSQPLWTQAAGESAEGQPVGHRSIPQKSQTNVSKREVSLRTWLLAIVSGAAALVLLMGGGAVVAVLLSPGGKTNTNIETSSGTDPRVAPSSKTTDMPGKAPESSGNSARQPVANRQDDLAKVPEIIDPFEQLGPTPGQEKIELGILPEALSVSTKPSLIVTDVEPEPDFVASTDNFKPVALKPFDLPFQPKVWDIDETGKFLAIMGERSVAVLSVPGFQIQRVIQLSESPKAMAVGPQHIAILSNDRKLLELINWQNGQSIGRREYENEMEFLVIRDGFLGISNATILKLDDLSTPPLVRRLESELNSERMILWHSSRWIVNGVRLNETLDEIVNLVHRLPHVNVAFVGGYASTHLDVSPYLMPGNTYNRFTSFSSSGWHSPGREFRISLYRAKDTSEGWKTTHFLQPAEVWNQKKPGEVFGVPADDDPQTIKLMHMKEGRWEGTVVDGQLILFSTMGKTVITGAYHLDLNSTTLRPKVNYDFRNPFIEPEIVEAPLDLIPGATSTVKIRVPRHFRTQPVNTVDHAKVTVDGDIVTLTVDNDALIRSFEQHKDGTSTFYKYFQITRKPLESTATPSEAVVAYLKNAVPYYERLTGYRTVGTPMLVELGATFKYESPEIWLDHTTEVDATAIVYWQANQVQTRWMADSYAQNLVYLAQREAEAKAKAKAKADRESMPYVPPDNFGRRVVGSWTQVKLVLNDEESGAPDEPNFLVLRSDNTAIYQSERGTWEVIEGKLKLNFVGRPLPPGEVRFLPNGQMEITFRDGGQFFQITYARAGQ